MDYNYTKRMPFAFLVGDHLVYVLITLLKAENPNKYRDIVPFLVPFHTQCVMMNAIYKCYNGSELGDNNRYGRWLPDFWAMLTALPADQVTFLRLTSLSPSQATPTLTWPGTCGSSVQ